MADPTRPLLTRLRARHFKSLGHLDLELGPLTVLVGPNGSGKSNVVALLRFLRDARRKGVAYAFGEQGGSPVIPQSGHSETDIGVTYHDHEGEVSYNLCLSFASPEAPVEKEALRLESWNGYSVVANKILGNIDNDSEFGYADRGRRDVDLLEEQAFVPVSSSSAAERRQSSVWGYLTRALPAYLYRIRIHGIDVVPQRSPQREGAAEPFEEDGRNLGAVLRAIRETPDGETVDSVLARLVDGVSGFRVQPLGSHLLTMLDYASAGDGQPVSRDLGYESDGTIRLLAILAAIYQPQPPSVLVLEEPEAGLHPGVLPVLADVILEASDRMQVIVTTHSPDLMDCFDPDVLRLVEKVNGETVVGKLAAEQRDLISRKLYQPSELMRIEGLVREP